MLAAAYGSYIVVEQKRFTNEPLNKRILEFALYLALWLPPSHLWEQHSCCIGNAGGGGAAHAVTLGNGGAVVQHNSPLGGSSKSDS